MLKPDTSWLSDEIQGYINGAKTIYFERSPEQQLQAVTWPLVQKHGMLPEGETLEQKISEKDYTKTKTFLAGFDMLEQSIARFKPWVAALSIKYLKFTKLGFNSKTGIVDTITVLA